MSQTQLLSEKSAANLDEKANEKSANTCGGNGKTGLLRWMPDSWLPYAQLARVWPPAGLFLIFFPHIFGILYGAILVKATPSVVLEKCALLFGASFFVSNSIHIWNDLIDAPLDAQVERTRHRPIPRGAVSPFAAVVFTLTQALGAALFLYCLPDSLFENFVYSLPGIIGWTYYPFAKRHTNFPQTVLGFSLAWGVVMGSLAMDFHPFDLNFQTSIDGSSLCLVLANIIWSMIYDTIYAIQDVEDDVKAGIKSLAVLFRGREKALLWSLLAIMGGLLFQCGRLQEMDAVYYLFAVGGAVGSLVSMVAFVDLKDKDSCAWWFMNGYRWAGGSIAAGLLGQYVLTLV